jgi:hypothetical protein
MESSSTVGGSKRKCSDRIRSDAICSNSKRLNTSKFDDDSCSDSENIISHECSSIEKDIWNSSKITNKNTHINETILSLKYTLDSMQHSIKSINTHLDLIVFHTKNNYDLYHSEFSNANDLLEKIEKENERIKNDLILLYKNITK